MDVSLDFASGSIVQQTATSRRWSISSEPEVLSDCNITHGVPTTRKYGGLSRSAVLKRFFDLCGEIG